MNKTAFRLKVIGVALLVASPIATVVLVAQRPHPATTVAAAQATDVPAARLSRQ